MYFCNKICQVLHQWELRKRSDTCCGHIPFLKGWRNIDSVRKRNRSARRNHQSSGQFLKNFQCHSCCMTQLVTQLIQMILELGPNFSITFRWVRIRLALWMWPDLDYIPADAHILMLGYYLVVVPWKCGAKIWSHKVHAQVVRFDGTIWMDQEEDQIDFAQKTSNVACLRDAEMCLKVLETGIYLKVLETSLYLKCCL